MLCHTHSQTHSLSYTQCLRRVGNHALTSILKLLSQREKELWIYSGVTVVSGVILQLHREESNTSASIANGCSTITHMSIWVLSLHTLKLQIIDVERN